MENMNTCQKIDVIINMYLKSITSNFEINEVIQYSLQGGKRVRSIIISSVSGLDLSNKKLQSAICFIELFHASSLIMDDIMDGDIYRRNRDSVFFKFGTTLAQLTAMYMLSLSLVELAKALDGEKTSKIFTHLMSKFNELCLGQYLDTCGKKLNIDEIIRLKTSSLFEISFILGWQLKENKKGELENLIEISNIFGQIYQIVDDFEDYLLDCDKGRLNYVVENGIDDSYNVCSQLYENFIKVSKNNETFTFEIEDLVKNLQDKLICSFEKLKK